MHVVRSGTTLARAGGFPVVNYPWIATNSKIARHLLA